MAQIELEPVEKIRVTVLMDNVTDLLLADQRAVTRFNAPKSLARSVPEGLIAEHGFSALVRFEKDGRERTLLFDTGVSPTGMVENVRRLGLSLQDVEVIVLSHGHWDHVTGNGGRRANARARWAARDDSSRVLESAQGQVSRARPS